MSARRDHGGRDDRGFGLVEFIVAMGIFSVVLAAFAVSVRVMTSTTMRVQSVADSATQGRAAVDALSRQLSYASAVNAPVRTGQDWYLELQTDAVRDGAGATCDQWRLLGATKQLQTRRWTVGLATTATTPTPWRTVAAAVVNDPATQPPFAVYDTDTSFGLLRVGVDLWVQNRSGPALESQGQYTMRNSNDIDTPAPTASAVCTQIGRP